jgi:hypothetical protein
MWIYTSISACPYGAMLNRLGTETTLRLYIKTMDILYKKLRELFCLARE